MKLSSAICGYVACVCAMILLVLSLVIDRAAARHESEKATRITRTIQHETLNSVKTQLEADVPMKTVLDQLVGLHIYPDSRSFIFDGDQPFQEMDYAGDERLRRALRSAINNKEIFEDDSKINLNGKDYILNRSAIPHTKLQIYTLTPYSSVTGSFVHLKKPILILISVGFIIMMVGIVIVVNVGMRPLKRLAVAADEIGAGNFDAPLPEKVIYSDVKCLRDAMERMKSSLSELIEQRAAEAAESGRIKSELEIASALQQSMLPSMSQVKKMNDCAIQKGAILKSAREVSGDMFDFYKVSPRLTYFIIDDVSGKGVPASLVMAATKYLFRFAVSQNLGPKEICNCINRILSEGNTRYMFVTAIVGLIDEEKRCVTLANAGHNPPIMLRTTSEGVDGEYIKLTPSLPLGLMEDTVYSETELTLSPGDNLLLYTDGFVEAENEDSVQFGEQEFLKIAIEYAAEGAYPQQLVERLADRVEGFSGNRLSDDMTALSISLPANEEEIRLQLGYDKHELERIVNVVSDAKMRNGWSEAAEMRVNLVIEELFANVIMHSHPQNATDKIIISILPEKSSVKVTIENTGERFDPLSDAPTPDLSSDLDDRNPGGLGLHLVFNLSYDVKYRYENGTNILTLNIKTE